ncbi:hypothetical protein HGRIS_008052 [Hohenbuehelia grisea]|uniref:Phosphoglycerate mutase-like protein n=1 Tax=Hohenbuehelia grisea TaxID=104357 RepID=A0ABR3J6U2_9AGAR
MLLFLLAIPLYARGCAGLASSFAGSPTSAVFPPPNATITENETFFPGASQVGFAGPTQTGDEANVIATAPALAKVDNIWPLAKPKSKGAKLKSSERDFDVTQHFGSLSPFNSVDSFGLPDASPQVPETCRLKQVHLLHRHGARYPTSGSGPAAFAAKVHAAATTGDGFQATNELKFLNTWTYKLGAETLTPFGRSQLFNLGVGFRVRYGELLKGFSDLPVFRTTSEARMVDSALNFAAGFFGLQSYQTDYHQLITIEEEGFNNTLVPQLICQNSGNAIGAFGSQQALIWANKSLATTTRRIQKLIKSSNSTTPLKLEVTDMIAISQLCAYETVALGFSEFCGLFTEEEWKAIAYLNDLLFWYSFGPGNPTAAAIGIGYVQELVSRLTQTPITECSTSLNCTLVQNNITFPVDQPIFVDATHDTVISTVITAMNFTSLASNGPLPTDHIPKNQVRKNTPSCSRIM